jgi:hypothetical protein
LSDNRPVPERTDSSSRLYAAVIVTEVVVIAALWLFGRFYA